MTLQASARVRIPKTSELVADELRGRIVDGTFGVGAGFPHEGLLVEEFAVSRPTLREALRILESEGIIEIRRGARGGARVIAPTADAMARQARTILAMAGSGTADIATAVTDLETLAVRQLAASREPGVKAEVRALLEPADGEPVALHPLLVSMANPALGLAHGVLSGVLALASPDVEGLVAARCTLPADDPSHRDLLLAISRGRSESAASHLARHVGALTEAARVAAAPASPGRRRRLAG